MDPEKLWSAFKTTVLDVACKCLGTHRRAKKNFVSQGTLDTIDQSHRARLNGRAELNVNLDRTGFPGERVCKAPCGLRRAFCSQNVRSGFPDALCVPRLAREIALFRGVSDVIGDSVAWVTDGQSTCARVGNPSNAGLALGCAVTSWLHG